MPKYELFDWVLKILTEREYVLNHENYEEIKKTIVYQLYITIQDILTEDLDDLEMFSKRDFEIKVITELSMLKSDYAKVFAQLQKVINDIKMEDLSAHFDQAIQGSKIAKKVTKFQNDLLSKVDGIYYTVSQAQEILGYSHKNSIYSHIKNGNLKTKKLSERKTIIFETDLDDFIQKTYKICLTDYANLSLSEKKSLHKN